MENAKKLTDLIEIYSDELESDFLGIQNMGMTMQDYVDNIVSDKPLGILLEGKGNLMNTLFDYLLARSIRENFLLYTDDSYLNKAKHRFQDNVEVEPDGGYRVVAKPSKSISYHQNI